MLRTSLQHALPLQADLVEKDALLIWRSSANLFVQKRQAVKLFSADSRHRMAASSCAQHTCCLEGGILIARAAVTATFFFALSLARYSALRNEHRTRSVLCVPLSEVSVERFNARVVFSSTDAPSLLRLLAQRRRQWRRIAGLAMRRRSGDGRGARGGAVAMGGHLQIVAGRWKLCVSRSISGPAFFLEQVLLRNVLVLANDNLNNLE